MIAHVNDGSNMARRFQLLKTKERTEEPHRQEYRSTGVQEYRSSGVQEYRSSGVQEFRSTGVQEFRRRN
jgi:hypothetical protein